MSTKKIHVFASDVIPFPGCPRSAGGIRSWQIISGLKENGFEVTFSFDLNTYLAKKTSIEIERNLDEVSLWCCHHNHDKSLILEHLKPDVAIYCNLNLASNLTKEYPNTILIVDLYGPIHFEDYLLFNGGLENVCTKTIDNLKKFDYILTVSDRQKYFWSAYLSLAGFSFTNLDPLVCPLSLDIPIIERLPSEKISIIFSGGFYPWQRPDRYLEATATYLDSVHGKLHIFGGPHEGLQNEMDVKSMLANLQNKHNSVVYHGYKPIEELYCALSKCWCALELMEKNIERELAVTMRTIEFLGSGTPVIYNDYSSLSELIVKYKAGWSLPTDNIKPLIEVLNTINDEGIIGIMKKTMGAKDFAITELNSEKNIYPLVNLLSNPLDKRVCEKKETSFNFFNIFKR